MLTADKARQIATQVELETNNKVKTIANTYVLFLISRIEEEAKKGFYHLYENIKFVENADAPELSLIHQEIIKQLLERGFSARITSCDPLGKSLSYDVTISWSLVDCC